MKFTTHPQTLVMLATHAILYQHPVRLVLNEGWTRPRNFPLPIKADKSTANREYRPLAILEWVDGELSGENAAAEARERAARIKRKKSEVQA